MNIAVVDDDLIWHQMVEPKIRQCIDNIIQIDFYNTAESFLENIKPYDIVFFDVMMGDGLNGIEASKIYKQHYPENNKFSIIMTYFPSCAKAAFSSKAFSFIEKAKFVEDLQRTIAAINDVLTYENQTLSIPLLHMGVVDIPISSIISIYKYGRKICINLTNKTEYTSLGLHQLYDLLPSDNFHMINRSEIINLRYIVYRPDTHSIKLTDNKIYHISRKYSDSFYSKYIHSLSNTSI